MKNEKKVKDIKEQKEFDWITLNLCTFSPYRERKLSKRQVLLVFGGKVGGPADNFLCVAG